MADAYPTRDARFWLPPDQRKDNAPRYQIIDNFVDSVRSWHNLRHIRYFEYLKMYGIDYAEFGRGVTDPMDEDGLRFNLCEPIIDTAINKVCKSRIVPMAITKGGSYNERRRAKLFNRFIAGLFNESGVFENTYAWVSDAFIGDVAIAKVTDKDERVTVERCDPTRVWWDPEEAHLTGSITTIAEDHFIDRYRLLEMLDEWDKQGKLAHEDADVDEIRQTILKLEFQDQDKSSYHHRKSSADVVHIREAWHARSGVNADDGAHVICIPGKMDLVAEDYGYVEVPHVFLTRKKPLYGLTSPGLMSSIAAGQMEHNRVTERIRIGHECSPPRTIIRKGGSVTPSELTDIPGSVMEADDPQNDVVQFNAQPVHPDMYQYRLQIQGDMQLAASVPEMSMSGKPPEGVTAAKALASLDDIVAEKLSQPLRMNEKFNCQIGYRCLQRVEAIAKRHRGKYVVKSDGGKRIEELNWKDVGFQYGSYRLQVFPTNFLSQTPSVRYDRLSEMHQNGEISEMEFRSLSEIPDLEADNDLETAPQDVVDMCIEAIMEKKVAVVAEAFDDHALIVQRGMKAYNKARVEAPDPDDNPDEFREHRMKMKLLANYINSARNWLQPAPPSPTASVAGSVQSSGPVDQGPMGMMPPPVGPPLQGPQAGGPPVNPFGPPTGEMISNGM